MSKIFDFEELTDHELFHLRYGKGAVIVAIPKEDCEKNKTIWDKHEQETAEEAKNIIKPIKQKISDLERKFSEMRGRVPMKKRNLPLDSDALRIKNEIESLKRKQKSLAYIQKKYFTNMQLAMFYTHNISPQNEVHTRFDRIIDIEELNHHVKIQFEFTDNLGENHIYHRKIISSACVSPDFEKGSHIIDGMVKRIVPIENVTLEIITRPKIETIPIQNA